MTASTTKEVAQGQQAFYNYVVIPWFEQGSAEQSVYSHFVLITTVCSGQSDARPQFYLRCVPTQLVGVQ
jgi:hypothetical protein